MFSKPQQQLLDPAIPNPSGEPARINLYLLADRLVAEYPTIVLHKGTYIFKAKAENIWLTQFFMYCYLVIIVLIVLPEQY